MKVFLDDIIDFFVIPIYLFVWDIKKLLVFTKLQIS